MIDLSPLIAHRGASAHAPENTLPAFHLAAAQGAKWIECDAKLTRDNRIILFHDDDLDRTTNAKGRVAEKNWDDLSLLDAGSWFGAQWSAARIPLLSQAIDCWNALGLKANIEIKPCPGRDTETAELVLAEIERLWPRERAMPLVSSFSFSALKRARRVAKRMPLGLLLEDYPENWQEMAREIGAYSIHCWDEKLTQSWAEAIKKAGYRLLVYTVNEAVLAKRLFSWGVDSIFTDRPGELRNIL